MKPLWVSVSAASKRLGVSPSRVKTLLAEGRLSGYKAGAAFWLISERSLEQFAEIPRSPGRPRKQHSEEGGE
jgi:excisionase family DNA binding protein